MAGDRRGKVWTLVQWVLVLVVGIGGPVLLAGPRTAAREMRHQLQAVGIGEAPKSTVVKVSWPVTEEDGMAAVKTATTGAGSAITGTFTLLHAEEIHGESPARHIWWARRGPSYSCLV
jgi:hypothetical protein